jgi:hypothetical protein
MATFATLDDLLTLISSSLESLFSPESFSSMSSLSDSGAYLGLFFRRVVLNFLIFEIINSIFCLSLPFSGYIAIYFDFLHGDLAFFVFNRNCTTRATKNGSWRFIGPRRHSKIINSNLKNLISTKNKIKKIYFCKLIFFTLLNII